MFYNFIPEVLWIGPLMVALILRPTVALVLTTLAVRALRPASGFPRGKIHYVAMSIYALLALLLLLGLFTQFAALAGIIVIGNLMAWGRRFPELSRESLLLYILLEAIFLCLLVTGAGPLALDSPL